MYLRFKEPYARRFGTLKFSFEILEHLDFVLEHVFSNFIPLKTDTDVCGNMAITYSGISKFFQPLQEGEMVPEYYVEVSKHLIDEEKRISEYNIFFVRKHDELKTLVKTFEHEDSSPPSV